MDADGKIDSFEQINAKDGMRDVSHNEGVRRGSIKAKVEFELGCSFGCQLEG